ncbi:MAG TPA: response regulator [Fibrobacteria bacterium]|nr:response regulator [Fibrobacteria bacterium]
MAKRVVVVDDSRILIRQISDFLIQQMGYEVVGTGMDGNQAVSLFRQYRPDLITLDITMPNKDGKAAMKEIMAEFPEAKVLMISAVKGTAMLQCIKDGAKGYIEKPLMFKNEQFVRDFKDSLEEIFA